MEGEWNKKPEGNLHLSSAMSNLGKNNTGVPTWTCVHCDPNAHDRNSPSKPEGVDVSKQVCSNCGKGRTQHGMNGCGAWCCCYCDACEAMNG